MCLAIPAKVEQVIDKWNAVVDIAGVQRAIATHLVDEVVVGDYLIVHVGHALRKLDEEEAMKTLELFAEIGIDTAVQSPAPGKP